MRSDPEGVLEGALIAYALYDYDAAAAYYSRDATFAMYVDDEIFPFAGEFKGREAIKACWLEIHEKFEIRRFEARNISAKGPIVRCQVDYELRHRASGEVIDGVLRLVAEVENGLIVREREYNDVERIRAFMRLCEANWNVIDQRES